MNIQEQLLRSILTCTECRERKEVTSTLHSPYEELRFVQQVGCISLGVHPYGRVIVYDVYLTEISRERS